jgi:hypothetical protein
MTKAKTAKIPFLIALVLAQNTKGGWQFLVFALALFA